jgi:hypothetical protein
VRPPQALSIERGHHRFAWDLRYPPPKGAQRELSIAAVHRNTPIGPVGPFVHPGRYTVRLTVDGAAVERPLEVRVDPRVPASPDDLQRQTELSMACYRGYHRAQDLREAIDAALARAGAGGRKDWIALRGTGEPDNPDILYGNIVRAAPDEETVVGLQRKLLFMQTLLQAADARPTPGATDAVKELTELLPILEQRWARMR